MVVLTIIENSPYKFIYQEFGTHHFWMWPGHVGRGPKKWFWWPKKKVSGIGLKLPKTVIPWQL